MSKKQAAYLSSLLNDAAPAPVSPAIPEAIPAPTRTPGTTLLARENALARVAKGEVAQVTELRLDPTRVRVWPGNPRSQQALNEDNCRDLIDAILAEGAQKIPAIVRRVSDDPNIDYEVIAGSRRLWTIAWLRANNYPDMMFLAHRHTLDDEAAFRISDIENRARKDVSDFERARTYLKALDLYYGGRQSRMLERLRLSKGWLSKVLTVGEMPEWTVAAFASPADIQLKVAYPLAQHIQALEKAGDKPALTRLKSLASELEAEQARRRLDGLAPIPASDVVKRLSKPADSKSDTEGLLSLRTGEGRLALSVLSSNRNGVSLRLHAASGSSPAELGELLAQALKELDTQGRGLRY